MEKRRWFTCGLSLLLLGMTACRPAQSGVSSGGDTGSTAATAGTSSAATADSTAATDTSSSGQEYTSPTVGKTSRKTTTAPVTTTTTVTTQKSVQPLSSKVQIWFQDALTDAFADTEKPASAPSSGTLHAARNEYESLQLVIRSTEADLKEVCVEAVPFEGQKVPTVEVGEIVNVRASRGSELMGDYSRGDCPTDFPEYYTKSGELGTIPKNKTTAAVVEVHVPKDVAPGVYKTSLRVSSAGGERVLPLTVQVHEVTLPDPADSEFSYTCWTYTAGFPGDHISLMNDLYFDAGSYNDNFWELMKNYAAAMAKERQNVIFVPINALLASDMTIDGNGKYHFTFKNFDRYLETYLQHGSVKYFAGSHLMDKDWYLTPEASDPSWPTHSCVTWVYYNDGGTVRTKWVFSDTKEAQTHLQQMLTALYDHLKAKGWDTMWLQYVSDEVDGEKPISQVRANYRLVQQLMPTCRTTEAGSNLLEKYGEDLQVPVPRIDDYDRLQKDYDAVMDDREVWGYTCCVPQGNFVNRMSDFPLLSTRIIGWYWYKQNLDGYLHWAWNYWDYGNLKPSEPLEETSCLGGPMDAWLVFPDIENTGVLEGTRATAVRDGFEDNELLRLADAKDPQAVATLLSGLVENSQTFERDPQKLLDARIELFQILDRE